MARAPPEKFSMLPGMGEVKVENLTKAFRQAFRTDRMYRRRAPETGHETRPAPPEDTTSAAPAEPAESAASPEPAESPAESPVEESALGEALQDTESRPIEGLPENFDSLPEEEQLQIAMQLSVDGFM